MTQFKFTLIFIILTTIALIIIDYYNGFESIWKYSVILILASYYLGQYSTKFSKKE